MKQKTPVNPSIKASDETVTSGESNNSIDNWKNPSDYSRVIIDSLDDELIVIDQDYRIIQINEVALQNHGKTRQEVIGRHCYDIAHGLPELCQPQRHKCPLKIAWKSGKPVRATHAHVYNVRGEERERYIDIIASPITDSNGNVVAVTGLIRDVTEAKDLELKIAEAHRKILALNTITGVVSQSLDLDTVLRNALNKTLEIMEANIGGILLLDEEKNILYYRVHKGLTAEYAKKAYYRPGEGIVGIVAQSGKPILSEDIVTDLRVSQFDIINTEKPRAFASIPLRSKDKVLGVINIVSTGGHRFTAEDVDILSSISTQIAIAIEKASLHQEVQRQDEVRGELLNELFSIQEEERKRIARELHDETSQMLASLTAILEGAAGMLPPTADNIKAILRKAQSLSINTLDEIHKLIYELRPTLLDDLGLVEATRWLADNNLRTAGIKVSIKITGRKKRLSPRLEAALFRTIQEAVYNIAKHAQAKKTSISLHFKKNIITVLIRDDGKGFDVDEAISSKKRPRSLGLLGMKERVELVDGTLNIRSNPGGEYTEIDIEIPLNWEANNNE